MNLLVPDQGDDWVELLSHGEVFRPFATVRCKPEWILYRDATRELERLSRDGVFHDAPRFAKASAALADAILLEAVTGGLLNELGKVLLHEGQELASDQVHTRAHVGWLWTDWPAESRARGDYVLRRREFEEFVRVHFKGLISYRGIIVVDADAAPAVRFLAVQEREHRANPTRRYQQSWGPRLHQDYSAQHPSAPIAQSVGNAMVAMIKTKP